MGGATHRDLWDKQGGPFFRAGKWANNAHEPIVKGGAHRVGGHQNGLPHCTAMDSVAASRRLNASEYLGRIGSRLRTLALKTENLSLKNRSF